LQRLARQSLMTLRDVTETFAIEEYLTEIVEYHDDVLALSLREEFQVNYKKCQEGRANSYSRNN